MNGEGTGRVERKITLPDGRTAYVMPPAIANIMRRFLDEHLDAVNRWANLWMPSDPERRSRMVAFLADATAVPAVIWDAMFAYLCFGAEPTCAECDRPGWAYDCLRAGDNPPVHRFLCERHGAAS